MLVALAPAGGADDAPSPAGAERPLPASEEEPAPPGDARAAPGSPWAFSLAIYTWLPGVDAEIRSGNLESTIDESMADIIDATKGVPISVGGRLEAYWKRLGVSVDTNYFNLRFREQDVAVGNVASGSAGVTIQMAFLEYSALFRIFGAPPAYRSEWAVESGPPRVDLYAGGRTIWADFEIEPETIPGASNDESLTSPLVGARAEVDIGPRWFFRIDGNVGGFGVDDVEFVGEGLGALGFRMTPLQLPTEIWLGYQVLYLEVDNGAALGRLETDSLFHGPALGLAFSW